MSDPFRLTRPGADVVAVAFLGAAVLAAAVTPPMSRGSGARAAEPAATPTAVEQARLGAARRALGDGDPAKAVAALEQAGPPAAADAPDSGSQRLFYLGLAHQELARKGGPNAAVSLQKSLDLYQQALKLKPGSPALLNNLAQVLADLNRLPEAAALLERALATPDRRQAFYTVNYGNVLVQLGKERDALRFCRAAAFGPPPDARAHSWVVRFHARRDLPGLAGYLREMLDRGGVVLVQESLIDLFDRTERPSRAAIPQPVEMELLAVLASCLSSQAYDPAEFGKTPAAAGLRKLAGQGGFAAERARELLALHESDRQLSADQFHWWVDPGEWGLGGDPTEAASKLGLTPGDALNALVRALGRRHQSAGRADVAERYFRLATRLVPGFTDPDAFVDLLDLYLEGNKKSQVDALAREFEAPLFQGKASSIRKREHDRTYRYHRALGVLYVHLQRWGDRNTVASATFQLETALQDALVFRREQTDRGDAGARAAGRRREPFAVDPRLGDMLVVSDERAGEAAIDGLWQAIMLEGVRERTPLTGEFLSYEAPTYFGMIVAAYAAKPEE